jgi:hypothetical protein
MWPEKHTGPRVYVTKWDGLMKRRGLQNAPADVRSVQSNFRTSSNSDGANWRPAALVMCTRHPDLNSIRAFATVNVGLVNCISLLSPFFDEEIVKPIFAGLTPARSLAGLSKRVLGLGIRAIEILAAGMIASGTPSTLVGGTGADTAALAGTSGRTAARCFDNLNHSTQAPREPAR